MLQSGLVIVLVVWNYSELDGTGALLISIWAALCTGGILHLAVWWKNRQRRPRSGQGKLFSELH